ncbi:MAG: hypothetical protein JWP37_2939 [Mucilaginibacter sp.]|nr:hypothetical protein [Mucilaginibacter sp.]
MNGHFLKTINYSESSNFKNELKKLIKAHKAVHLQGVPSRLDHITFYTDLVDTIGKVVNVGEDAATGNLTGERWTDVRYIKDMASTFRHSNTRQPLHTDAAYTNCTFDVNFFFALENAEIGGATVFIDGADLIHILRTYEPGLFERLIDIEIVFQKGDEPVRAKKIVEIFDDHYELNWNYFRVSDENSEDIRNLCGDFNNFLENKIVAAGILKPVYLQAGDGLFFHDDQVLHGRNSFYGNRHLIKGAFDFS